MALKAGDVLCELDGRPLFSYMRACAVCHQPTRHETLAVEDRDGEHEVERCWECGTVAAIHTLRRSVEAIEREQQIRHLKAS